MELKELVRALRRFWPLALGVLLLCIAVGAAAAFVPEKRYRANVTLLVEPRGSQVDFNSVAAIQFLLPSLIAQVKTDSFKAAVLRAVPPELVGSSPKLDATIESGTGIFHIIGESSQPVGATIVANQAATEAVSRKISDRFKLSLLQAATTPSSPATPLRGPILLGATGLGLIVALFSALGANALRRRLGTGDEIRERFGLDVLAEIPKRRHFPKTAQALFKDEEHPELSEAFQRLRTNLELTANDTVTIAVTSATAGEGKSTVTANLAWAFASLGHDVVAIDCDLRRPALHSYLGGRLNPGVSDAAEGAKLHQLTQSVDSSLSMIAAGHVDAHPAQILHTALPRLLSSLNGRLVLLDSPPMLGVSEAPLITAMAKAVLLVIDAQRRDPSELERVLRDLSRGNAHLLGVVVNRSKMRQSQYAYSYYQPEPARSRRGR